MCIEKKIIKRSIRSAICIDDEFLSPYEDNPDNKSTETPKELYESFRKEGHCNLDIYHYTTIEQWKMDSFLLQNKDLLILDWELDNIGVQFRNTLNILKEVIDKKKNPFVVIYSHTEKLSDIPFELKKCFNNFSANDYNELINQLNERLSSFMKDIDFDELIENHESDLFGVLETDHIAKSVYSSFVQSLIDANNTDIELDKVKCENKLLKIFDVVTAPEELINKLALIYLGRNEENKSNYYNLKKVDVKEYSCYSINGTLVLILAKKGEHNGVEPDNVFTVFSEAIVNKPHNLIDLISLELKDRLREDFSVLGTKFNEVSEDAFLLHANNYVDEEGFNKSSFRNFVIESWLMEIGQYANEIKLDSLTNLKKEQIVERANAILDKNFGLDEIQKLFIQHINPWLNDKKVKIENLKELNMIPSNPQEFEENLKRAQKELVKYASLVSNVNLENRTNTKLRFGDLFKTDNTFFLCITPHCDCLRPSKISNQFYFVIGEVVNNKTALGNAEEGYFSFIMDKEEPKCIEWKCKPFSSHISNENNNIEQIKISHMGKEIKFQHVTILKENYTQRIANESFGYGLRVGIDLPHLK